MKINQHGQVLWNWRRFLHLELIDGHHLSFAAHPGKLYLGPKFEYFPWDLPECRHHHYGYSKSHIMLQANNSSNRIQNVPGFGCFENRFCGEIKNTSSKPRETNFGDSSAKPCTPSDVAIPDLVSGGIQVIFGEMKCGWLVAMLLQCLQSIRDSTKLGWFHPPNKQSLTLPTTVISWRFSRTWAVL